MARDTKSPPTPRRSPGPNARETRGALLLLSGTPREILARLVRGDPLGLRAVVEATLRRRALLFDAPTVLRRSLVLVARRAHGWRGRPSLSRWLGARVEEALDQLLDEDPDCGCAGGSPDPLADLGRPLGLDGSSLRRARVRFHRLDRSCRESFLSLVIEGTDLDLLARASGNSASHLARGARRGLEAWCAGTFDGSFEGECAR